MDGTVTGGTQPAVLLAGGGALIVGPTGRLVGGSSGRAVLVNDPGPAVVAVLLNPRVGDSVADMKRRLDGGDRHAIEGGPDVISVIDPATGRSLEFALDGNGFVTIPRGRGRDIPWFCDLSSGDGQCRLYEALPSVLLGMNDLPTRAERMSAPRDARGGWMRVEAGSGKWKADTSTRPNLRYDHRRYGVRAGMDFAVSETVRLGFSAHLLEGKAEMASPLGGDNEIDVSGTGVGVHATAMMAGGVHVTPRPR